MHRSIDVLQGTSLTPSISINKKRGGLLEKQLHQIFMVVFYTIDDNVRKKIAWRRKEVCAENSRPKERPRNSVKTPTNRSRYVDRIKYIDRSMVCKQPPEITISFIRINFSELLNADGYI